MNAAKILSGHKAIEHVVAHGGQLRKYSDPVEGARQVSVSEAREIASEDPSLIWAIVDEKLAAFHAATGLAPTTLDDLTIALVDLARMRDFALDMSNLPTYGGKEPTDTLGVWSWDAESLLVGEGTDLSIVARA